MINQTIWWDKFRLDHRNEILGCKDTLIVWNFMINELYCLVFKFFLKTKNFFTYRIINQSMINEKGLKIWDDIYSPWMVHESKD